MDSRWGNVPNSKLSSVQSATTTALQALDIDHVLESVLLNVRKSGVALLLPLRLVNHKWNNAAVKILEETHQKSFTKIFRMHDTTRKLPYELEELAIEDLDEAIMTFSSTATPIKFSRVQFDYFYFMTDVFSPRLNFFTDVHGPHIQHLIFDGRYEGTDSFVCNDDYEIVTLNSLGTIFKGTPNLETLNFKLSRRLRRTRIFPEGDDLPKLEKLVKIEIYEVDAQKHNDQFLEDLFRMAPNLIELSIECFESITFQNNVLNHYMNLFRALGAPEVQILPNLVNLKLSFAPFVTELSAFGFFNLTTLEITSVQKHEWNSPALTALLESVKTTLVTLKLGDTLDWDCMCRKWEYGNSISCMDTFSSIPFPSVMECLKTFEVNFVIFPIFCRFEESQFPVLENLRIILPIPNKYRSYELQLIRQYFQIVKGSQVGTLKKFAVFCTDVMKDEIMRKFSGVEAKFPNAEIYFGSPLEYEE